MTPTLTITRDVDQPPGGWRFLVEETGVEIRAASADILGGKVFQHMKVNNLQRVAELDGQIHFKEWFENELCKQLNLGEPFCGQPEKVLSEEVGRLSPALVERFVNTMWQWMKRGMKLVPQELADTRSRVCADCPLNVTVKGGCEKCYEYLKVVASMLGDSKSAEHDRMAVCAKCGCQNALKVWCPKNVLDAAEKKMDIEWPDHCWRKTEK